MTTARKRSKRIIYINLTNGIEAIPTLSEDYRFIRIQSTFCEQKLWDRMIQDLDYDFLMNLALGNLCVVYDFGANKPLSRALYQGLEFIKYVLNKRWLNKDYAPNVNRSTNRYPINNCRRYFVECYHRLENRTLKKLDYFSPFIMTDEINMAISGGSTIHDGDRVFYKEILNSTT